MAALRDLFRRLPGDVFDRVFLAVFLCAIAVAVVAYPWMSAEVPIHFDRSLRPDRFVGKPWGPFVLPAVAAVLYGLAFPVVWFLRAVGLDVLRGVVKITHLALALVAVIFSLLVGLGLLGH
ncbi:MAG: DUF1648 domain-containing protein [Burkholderiaceae bacterium]